MNGDFFDIKTDERFTYSMRIELGKLFADKEAADVEKFKAAFRIIYGHEPRAVEYAALLPHFERIVDGLRYWAEAEAAMLSTEPSADEVAAGAREYAARVGELATVVSLAKDFGVLPNEILKRPYSEIFGVLVADCERGKFERRLRDIIEKRYKWKQ